MILKNVKIKHFKKQVQQHTINNSIDLDKNNNFNVFFPVTFNYYQPNCRKKKTMRRTFFRVQIIIVIFLFLKVTTVRSVEILTAN